MRFSGIFQLPRPPRRGGGAGVPVPEEAPVERSRAQESHPQELPEDLDARVRLVGEWQLGEG